jgi:hypothetical protein
VIFWWQWPPSRIPDLAIYDPNILFWLGAIQMDYAIIAPLPVLFLTLDRICALKPTEVIGQRKNRRGLCEKYYKRN